MSDQPLFQPQKQPILVKREDDDCFKILIGGRFSQIIYFVCDNEIHHLLSYEIFWNLRFDLKKMKKKENQSKVRNNHLTPYEIHPKNKSIQRENNNKKGVWENKREIIFKELLHCGT